MVQHKTIYLVLIIVALFAMAGAIFLAILNLHPKIVPQPSQSSYNTPLNLSKKMQIGSIGEITAKDETTGKATPVVNPITPPAIFSDTGVIKEIKKNSLVVTGDGQNFADKKPRTLTLSVTNSTIIIDQNSNRSTNGKGLKLLKKNQKILFDSFENIRGKIKFTLKTLKVI